MVGVAWAAAAWAAVADISAVVVSVGDVSAAVVSAVARILVRLAAEDTSLHSVAEAGRRVVLPVASAALGLALVFGLASVLGLALALGLALVLGVASVPGVLVRRASVRGSSATGIFTYSLSAAPAGFGVMIHVGGIRRGGGIIAAIFDVERKSRVGTAAKALSGSAGAGTRRVRAVYCALDPAAAILELAVHKTLEVLDAQPHVLTSLTIIAAFSVHVVEPGNVPNPRWSISGNQSRGQLQFGNQLLAKHKFVVIPSAVSSHSWNLLFVPANATGAYRMREQERSRSIRAPPRAKC